METELTDLIAYLNDVYGDDDVWNLDDSKATQHPHAIASVVNVLQAQLVGDHVVVGRLVPKLELTGDPETDWILAGQTTWITTAIVRTRAELLRAL